MKNTWNSKGCGRGVSGVGCGAQWGLGEFKDLGLGACRSGFDFGSCRVWSHKLLSPKFQSVYLRPGILIYLLYTLYLPLRV